MASVSSSIKCGKLCILSLGSLQVLHSITWNYLFTGLGIISTVVKMFTSPLPPPHVSQIFPFTYLTSPFIGRKKKKSTVLGHGGQELFDSHSFDKCVSSWIHLSPGAGIWAKQTQPQTSGTSQCSWTTSEWLLPGGDGVSLGGFKPRDW